jgi:hypothetical protein
MDAQIIFAAAFPILMFVGGIAAWRMSKKQVEDAEKPPAWRDDSLDDWRRERDAQAEAARATRPAELRELSTGSEQEQETTKKHQRIGG